LKKKPDVVSWWVGEGTRRRMEDADFASRLDQLDKKMSLLLTSASGMKQRKSS